MSLLYEALEKAKREDVATSSGVSVDASPVSSPSSSLRTYILLSLVVTCLAGTVYFRFLRKSLSPPPRAPVSLVPTHAANPSAAAQMTEEGKKKLEMGEFEAARVRFEKAVILEPRNAEAYNNLGLVLKKMSLSEEAFEQYRKALAINPQCSECLNNLGVLYLSTHDLAEAESHFQQAILARPDYADPYFHLALLLESRGDLVAAKKNYQRFLELAKGVSADLLLKVQKRVAGLQTPHD